MINILMKLECSGVEHMLRMNRQCLQDLARRMQGSVYMRLWPGRTMSCTIHVE